MLAYFKALLNLPELFVGFMESFEPTGEAQEAVNAACALAED